MGLLESGVLLIPWGRDVVRRVGSSVVDKKNRGRDVYSSLKHQDG